MSRLFFSNSMPLLLIGKKNEKVKTCMYSSIAIFCCRVVSQSIFQISCKSPRFFEKQSSSGVNFSQRVGQAAVPLPDIINKVPAGADITNGFNLQ